MVVEYGIVDFFRNALSVLHAGINFGQKKNAANRLEEYKVYTLSFLFCIRICECVLQNENDFY